MDTAYILAAGLGSRLGSTKWLPKSMRSIPILSSSGEVVNQPIIGYILDQLSKCSEIERVIISLNFGREIIEDYIKKHFDDRFNLIFPTENEVGDKIYETMSLVKHYLSENVLMINSDIYSNIDLKKLIDDHEQNYNNGILYTIAAMYVSQGAEKCGIIDRVKLEKNDPFTQEEYLDSSIETYEFLPKGHGRNEGLIDSGIVAFPKRYIDFQERFIAAHPGSGYHDARKFLYEVGLGGISLQEGFWDDIGTPYGYRKAKKHARNLLGFQYLR